MNKSTIVALLVFIGLAVAAAFTLRQPPERGITRISLADVKPDRITRVVIESPDKIELSKDGAAWKLDGKPADAGAVERLIEGVGRIESSELTTRNSERFAELELEAEKGAKVALFAGSTPAAEFTIGKAGRGGSYVRVGDAVYLVRGVYRGTFARPRANWLERQLFTDKIDGVQKVEVRLTGETPYTLSKENDHWKLEGASLPPGQRFDEKAAGTLVGSLVSIQATDFLNDDPGAEQTGLDDGADRLVFHLRDGGDPRVLELGKDKDGAAVYAKASTRTDIATIPSSMAHGLRKKLGDLRDLRIMAFDPSAVKRLEVAGTDERFVLERQDAAWKVAEASADLGGDFALDPALVGRRIAMVADLKATAEADGASAKVDPKTHVALTLNDDRIVRLDFGDESKRDDQDVVLARGNADDRSYFVTKSNRDSVLRGPDSLKKVAAPAGAMGGLGGIDPQQLQNLPPDVREALMKQMAEQQQKQKLLEAMQKQQAQTGSH
jgi:hypothetical protein